VKSSKEASLCRLSLTRQTNSARKFHRYYQVFLLIPKQIGLTIPPNALARADRVIK